uniref:Aquaporin n=1 Tax=Heterorhabditis bacteriophora TaxID=37862 RepID=A0A1I7XP85_HETBA
MPYYHLPFYMISQLLGGFCGSLYSAFHCVHSCVFVRCPLQLLVRNRYNRVLVSVAESSNPIRSTAYPNNFHAFDKLINSTLLKAIMTNFQLNNTNAGATLLYHANTWWEGLLSEAVATYFLCHTILLTAVDSNKVVLAPLAIGLTLSIDILSTSIFIDKFDNVSYSGSITGASMNPARSLGPNIVGQIFLKSLPPGFWSNHYIYWAGPFMGATVAVIIYKCV